MNPKNLNSDGSAKDAPNPLVRQQMTDYALKGSKLESAFKKATEFKTAEEQALFRLHMVTEHILREACERKRLGESAGLPFDEHAEQKIIMGQWLDFLSKEGKENCVFLSTIVLTGITLEKLDEVV